MKLWSPYSQNRKFSVCYLIVKLTSAKLCAKQIRVMEESGHIEPSNSEWTSPVVLVKKKNNTCSSCKKEKQYVEISSRLFSFEYSNRHSDVPQGKV